jgi:4-hydroxy-tetrahydrodipicolinate synthase
MGKLHGCIPIVATPFTEEGAIDEASLRAEVEHLIAAGVHGLATPAIASEGYKLAEAEQQRVAAIVVETAGSRVPVVVSAGGNGTDVAVMRARRAAASGAAALMVLPPMFIKPDGENLYRYYQRIARAVEVEIMVQDVPQLTGVALPAPLLARLNSDCPNITAVKIEGTPAGPKTSEVLALSDERMDVFAGWGGLSLWESLQRGAKGCMPAANFGPALARVYDQYCAGDFAAARSLFDRLVPFVNWSMQSVDLSVWCAKEALRRDGILATSVLREPASLPDAVMRHQFEVFYAL